jgi:RNA polymerase sigma factor (sigma-70 family)
MNLITNTDSTNQNNYIISAFRLGNSKVIIQCYQQILPYITLFLRSHGMPNVDADELAWASIEGFRRNCLKPDFDLIDKEGKFIPCIKYLKGIAKNVCFGKKEELTKKQAEILHATNEQKKDGELQTSPFNQATQSNNDTEFNQTIAEALQLTEQLIAQLPPKCHQIIRLSCYNDLPYSDIATQLDTNESTLRKRLFDCRRMLVQTLKNSPYTDMFEHIDFMKKYVIK